MSARDARTRDPTTGFPIFTVTPAMLRTVEVLAALDDEALARISRRCEGLRCAPEQCLVSDGDESNAVFFIVEGRVKITQWVASDREVVLREMMAGDLFGELAAISGKPRSAEVSTTVETKVARISAQGFWTIMLDHPVAMQAIVRHIVEILYSLSERVIEHDSLKVGSRIHAELARMAHARGVEDNRAALHPVPTRESLAKLVGTTRYAVSKELRSLQRAKIIELGWRRIDVANVSGLDDLVELGKKRGRYTPVEESAPDSTAARRRSASTRRERAGRSARKTPMQKAMAPWNRVVRAQQREQPGR